MAFVNGCDAESSSPYCICTDYYGNVLPEYRSFNTTTQTFSCCNELKDFALPRVYPGNPTSAKSGTDWVLRYAKQVYINNQGCLSKLGGIEDDINFKEELPLLYYQGFFNASLFSNFTSPSKIQNKIIQCSNGIPYVVKYPNYSNSNIDYKILCGSNTTSKLENLKYLETNANLDYSLSYILNNQGQPCLTSYCETKYDVSDIEYNIGDTFYKSPGNINGDSVLLKTWFWFILLFVGIFLGVGIYYWYYHYMDRHFEKSVNYLNNVKKGLGDTAKKHSKKNQNAHFHINT